MKAQIGSISLSAAVLVASLAFGFQPAPQPAAPFGPDPFIGEIVLFGGNFAPQGWARCEGQLISIAQNAALFSILGTTYGGDGQSTFGLPDLRGRVPVGAGNGPGLSNYALGQKGGTEMTTLSVGQMPNHTHQLLGHAGMGDTNDPLGRSMSTNPSHRTFGPDANAPLSSEAIDDTGGNGAHENRQPYLGLNYIIALVGVFPSD